MWTLIDSTTLKKNLKAFCEMPGETEWLEFKVNPDLKVIGEYISALANSAACLGRDAAYLIFGVDDRTHTVVGTKVSLQKAKINNQELESWLLQKLSPKIYFRFHEIEIESERLVVIVEIQAAQSAPIKFDGEEYIRIGSYKKHLRDYPEQERVLWRSFDQIPFERQPAAENLGQMDVFELLDVPSYFRLIKTPLPESRDTILKILQTDQLISEQAKHIWSITNLGAVALAKDLNAFPSLARKAVRIIKYSSRGRTETEREISIAQGYAGAFETLIKTVMLLLPTKEIVQHGLRRQQEIYSELALRELIANALIHQDFSISGTGPMIEIFSNRVEITNPGTPLIPPERFLDLPPRSKNEALASLMRRMDICEERGSGYDKVAATIEKTQTPAPTFEVTQYHLRVTLSEPKTFAQLSKQEKIQMCYLHCVLRYINKEMMNNTSLRERFGIEERNRSIVSRVISEAVKAGEIKVFDVTAGTKNISYIPSWA